MRLLIQRISQASVKVEDKTIAEIKKGLLILLGITDKDTENEAKWLAEKAINLRLFPNENQEFDKSVLDIGGEVLVVSQFTLYGSCDKGRRPDFGNAAKPEKAEPLYKKFIDFIREKGVKVEHGEFGAMMHVSLVNEGPATFWLEK